MKSKGKPDLNYSEGGGGGYYNAEEEKRMKAMVGKTFDGLVLGSGPHEDKSGLSEKTCSSCNKKFICDFTYDCFRIDRTVCYPCFKKKSYGCYKCNKQSPSEKLKYIYDREKLIYGSPVCLDCCKALGYDSNCRIF